MRKLTITLLLIITIIFAACSRPETKPVAQPQTPPEDKPPVVIKSLRISKGRAVETTHKIYGGPPKDCEEAAQLGVPCFTKKPSKLTPAEQDASLKPRK